MRRTPLAWLNLTHDLRRLTLAVTGVGIAVLLMCIERSIHGALLENSVAVIEHMRGDLFIVSKAQYTIAVRETFSQRRLAQARACPDVAGAYPLYIETHRSNFKNLSEKQKGEAPPIRVLAFNPDDPVFDFPQIAAHRAELRLPSRALFDERSKPEQFGVIAPGAKHQQIELAGHQLQIVGLFSLGTDFANDGNVITSDVTYRQTFPLPNGADPLDTVDIGVLQLKRNRPRDMLAAQRQLQERFPRNADGKSADVDVLTKEQFLDREKRFWTKSTPIGFIFWLGQWMGFVVGLVICYQVLSSDVHDHLRQFATLRAMGYASRYFIFVLLLEAVLLSLMGFMWSVPLSMVLCRIVATLTGLRMHVTAATALLVLVMSAAMCIVSGCLALVVHRLMKLDPAELLY
jgi:putative ABC transport system permease protein